MKRRCGLLLLSLLLLQCVCAAAGAQEKIAFRGIPWGTDAQSWAHFLKEQLGVQPETGVGGSRIVCDTRSDDPCCTVDADTLTIFARAGDYELYGLPVRTVEAYAAGTQTSDEVVSVVFTFSCSSEARAGDYWETLTAALRADYGTQDVRYDRGGDYPKARSEVWLGAEDTYAMAHLAARNALSAEVTLCLGVMPADERRTSGEENATVSPRAPQGSVRYEWRTVEVDCPSCVNGSCSVCNGTGWYRLYGQRVACSVLCSACKGSGVIVQSQYVPVP